MLTELLPDCSQFRTKISTGGTHNPPEIEIRSQAKSLGAQTIFGRNCSMPFWVMANVLRRSCARISVYPSHCLCSLQAVRHSSTSHNVVEYPEVKPKFPDGKYCAVCLLHKQTCQPNFFKIMSHMTCVIWNPKYSGWAYISICKSENVWQ